MTAEPQQVGNSNESQSSNAPVQPQYGQVKQPEFGQMAAQFPADYDPYVYGKPESEDNGHKDEPQQSQRMTNSQDARVRPSGMRDRQSGMAPQGFGVMHREDFDDPQRNPLYGRWDVNAVLALVMALFSVPILPIIVGAFSMRRTRMLHMKGYWLALAAVVLGTISFLLRIWLISHGITTDEVYQWLMNRLGSTASDPTGGISA